MSKQTPNSIPQLPAELMLEISSWMLDLPLAYFGQHKERLTQIATSRALSQTCQLFRGVFLPHLWSLVDGFFDGEMTVLELRMREIVSAKYLLEHVKLISLSLHGPALRNSSCAEAFLSCIHACPNLESIKIVSLRTDRPPSADAPGAFEYLYTAFRPYSFPSVKMLVFPDLLAPVLPSFPNVRSLLCGEDRPTAGFRLMEAAKVYCPHLEQVTYGGFSRVMIGWIAVTTPNIERLILRTTLFEDDFSFMRTMTNLCYLEFAHRTNDNQRFPALDDCVKHARDLLSISRNPKPKKIRIKTVSGQTDTVLSETVIDLP
ncbi:hypothetical protein R3P38DRAFT_2844105 [Favolaschia claudopus]|uniref:F-box domain-containing protein n=1 Tax=Favolaschia claudopus TaxID=2862362 RepID=A0AAW0E5W5_9AGAR